MDQNPTERFTNRAANYVENRPGYPPELFSLLSERYGLGYPRHIADIGAGTGISTRLLLERGARVTAIEPNQKMRSALRKQCASCAGLRIEDRTAEKTGLEANSVDGIFVAQAFHWFDRNRVRDEFHRILHPRGFCVLVWNERDESAPLVRQYISIIDRLAAEDPMPRGDAIRRYDLPEFYAPGAVEEARFSHAQRHDREGFLGRALSASYVPLPGQPNHEPLVEAMHAAFDTYAKNGEIEMHYVTRFFHGTFSP